MIRVSLIRLVFGTMVLLGATAFLVLAPAAVGVAAGATPGHLGADPAPGVAGVEVEQADPGAPAMVSVASRRAGTGALAAVCLLAVTSLSLCAGGWMLWRRCATGASSVPPASS